MFVITQASAPAQWFWSSDGLAWTEGTGNPTLTGQTVGLLPLIYGNGMWEISISYGTFPKGTGSLLSCDGKAWTFVFARPPFGGGSSTFDSANNRWVLTAVNPPAQNLIIPNPNTPSSLHGTLIYEGGVSNPGPFASADLSYSLPGSITAVRAGFGGPPFTFDYTTDTITSGIRNSGAGWPDASWTTSFTFTQDNPSSSTGIEVIFGLSGGSTTLTPVSP